MNASTGVLGGEHKHCEACEEKLFSGNMCPVEHIMGRKILENHCRLY